MTYNHYTLEKDAKRYIYIYIYCLNNEISDRHKRPIKGMFTETHEKSEHIYTRTYAKDYNR